jgi:queuine tRNA-ribosyltransferase
MDNFHLFKQGPNSNARAGELITAHGVIPTPVFMPVGSQATVKTLTPDELKTLGYKIILANNYHLNLRPGAELIQKLGGLHRFMNWDGAILTDSGGYQVFSLAALTKLSDEGVTFRSHIDGSSHFITPERAIELQEALGADIIMVLDEPSHADAIPEKVNQAMQRTHRWAERCLKTQKRTDQQLFAIVQGGFSADMRRQSAEYLTSLDFPGYALGGLSLGEAKDTTWEMTERVLEHLPVEKPRYLMGVGAPEDILEAVSLGVDMLDCALPTRVARNGALFTSRGRINIDNAGYRELDAPIEIGCDCFTCTHFSTAYLNHLFRAEELLAYRLATIHNLRFMSRLMQDMRRAILDSSFSAFKKNFHSHYQTTDEAIRLSQKQKWLKGRKVQVE